MVVLSQVYGKCLFACTTIKYNYAVGKTRATPEMSFGFTVINSSTFIKTAPEDKKKKRTDYSKRLTFLSVFEKAGFKAKRDSKGKKASRFIFSSP